VTAQASSYRLFGIRHHGPGSARALRAALDEMQPDAVLVEGPPDAEEVLPLLIDGGMKPPVALLIYAADEPRRAVYYPFAEFSPEWQALRWALERGVPARFMDLPQSIQLALDTQEMAEIKVVTEGEGPSAETLPDDPIGMLAEAAGYADRELWWEQQVEQRRDPAGLFEGILQAMTELRSQAAPRHEAERLREERREAFMRQRLRAAQKEGFARIAVVCGAWHTPALATLGPAKPDAATLKDLPKLKVAATWIPWTYSRLAYRSGYGAGVSSPGWYQHLWTAPDRSPVRWVTQAARLLRLEDLDASPAGVIESVRLAETLAALRGHSMPGLAELDEAIQAVLCHGEPTPMALVRQRLEIGEALGEVPPETPSVPLQRDLDALQKRLRLKPSAEVRSLDLDLREETGRERSHLLHRLRLLSIPWGQPEKARGKSGTFHELWQIAWSPEFAVLLIEGNIWGNTVETASAAAALDAGSKLQELPALTELLDRVILAGLPAAVEGLLAHLQDRAAVAADLRHLMDALPPLARVMRYGDVRETRSQDLLPVLRSLFERVVVGLPGACGALADDAAEAMAGSVERVQESVALLDLEDLRQEWTETLERLAVGGAHGLIRGYACRLLLDQKVLEAGELETRARLALATAVPPRDAASWVAGLLRGSGLLLLHHDGLWVALDGWLSQLTPDAFTELLPLLRRAFAAFQPPERRRMGEKVKHLGSAAPAAGAGTGETEEIDVDRAARVLPVLAQILGGTADGAGS